MVIRNDFSSQRYCGIGVLFNTDKHPNCSTKLCTVNGSEAIKEEALSKMDL
jgi:hypothetical protein